MVNFHKLFKNIQLLNSKIGKIRSKKNYMHNEEQLKIAISDYISKVSDAIDSGHLHSDPHGVLNGEGLTGVAREVHAELSRSTTVVGRLINELNSLKKFIKTSFISFVSKITKWFGS